MKAWEIVIGIETHAQLSTHAKIFSGSSTAFGAEPNLNADAIDIALPGVLPVLNRGAVDCAIRFGLAVGAEIAARSVFARKNYFYPDLPKGYQISQYEQPVVRGGKLTIQIGDQEKEIRLTRAHLEEDAGKSLHEESGHVFLGKTAIDLNRAGTPLLEIVSEPDLRSSSEAVAYARALHALVRWIGICDGNMQEGSFRCDANVSVRPIGQRSFGTRREIKNLNSFRFLQQAIDFEVQWQIATLEDGGHVEQATVLFDPVSGETRSMRSKENAHDYRYFPDPDLPPLVIDPQWIETIRTHMPVLPAAKREHFVRSYGLPTYDAGVLTASLEMADFFEATLAAAGAGTAKTCANWVMGDFAGRLNKEGRDIGNCPLTPEQLGGLIARIADTTLSTAMARKVFDALWNGEGRTADEIIAKHRWQQISDKDTLEKLIDDLLAGNAATIAEYRSGKEKAFNALIGQAMKATRGQANPQQVAELLRKKLT